MIIESYFNFSSQQNLLENDVYSESSQSTIVINKTSSLNTSNAKKEYVAIELSGNSQETNVEQANDPLNEPNCIYLPGQK